ncbi:MAG: tRNA glutamyl-Q(34) synthetase GluQRS [Ilumatobacteraceae bacterium]
MHGRFAPSPTGALHLGNLRTALIAWLMARQVGGAFLVRMEDLDRVTSSPLHEADQLDSLRAIGIDWDGEVVRQSDRFGLYHEAIGRLRSRGLLYECYCSRREIREAAAAPQGTELELAYPGTCRYLSDDDRNRLRSAGRRAALRLRSDGRVVAFDDRFSGRRSGRVDDFVLQRNDGVPAYNLAVVVDDAAQGVTEVVRGDDLVSSTPRQIALQQLLDLPTPRYAHVPLVLAPDGSRLAKRHGAVTLHDLGRRGCSPHEVCARLAASIGIEALAGSMVAADLLGLFDPQRLPPAPWRLTAGEL